ncbi:MAG: Ribosomal protein S6 kinase beta-2 [Paramarteilia canceri]
MVLEKHYNNKIRVIDQIGQGGFGKVYLIRTRSSDEYPDIQYYAMKVILKSRIINSEKKIIYAKNEMEILASIDNPFVVKLYYAFHCSEKLYLIMELMTGGDLRRLMNQKITLTENETKFYTASITMALEHLHSLKIIYRDLKPENVMFDVNGCLKLVDLGLCKVVNSVDEKTSTICGTIEYLAPEVVSKKRYDMMVDWWSLGILTYDMLLGSTPFPSDNRKKLINKIVSEVPNIPKLVSKEATSFMKQLLFKNPKKRLGVNSNY